MNSPAQLADKIKRLAVFCLEHQGRCFAGWSAEKLFKFLAWHWLNGTLFVEWDSQDNVLMVAVCWADDAREIQRREAAGLPQFAWSDLPKNGDAILVADVIGNRKFMAGILKQLSGAWPDSPRKRLFTYRREKLVELNWPTVSRLTYGKQIHT